jgi:hypothetical protein
VSDSTKNAPQNYNEIQLDLIGHLQKNVVELDYLQKINICKFTMNVDFKVEFIFKFDDVNGV